MVDFKNKSVAVVGSSGHLLERDYAKEIDSHDIVIRFNQARVKGYEKFVGSKTTHRIVNTHTFLGTTGNKRFPKNDPNFITKLENQEILIIRPVDVKKIKLKSPNNRVSILSDEFWNHCRMLLNNKKNPSVGFIGVLLAIQTSKKVDVYGFDQLHTTYKKHYWEDVKVMGSDHDFSIEKKIFKQLHDDKIISIFK